MTAFALAERERRFGCMPMTAGTASADPEEYPHPRDWCADIRPISRLPMPCKARMIDIVEGDCRLRKPIVVSISRENGCFYVENEQLGHYGVGGTVVEAVRDMFHSLCVVYKTYKNAPPESLDAGARKLLALHEGVLERAE